jgi:hypothetical protein
MEADPRDDDGNIVIYLQSGQLGRLQFSTEMIYDYLT